MPYTKKILRCHFCHKKLTIKKYKIEHANKIYDLCSLCEWLYNILKREMDQDRFVVIRKMLNYTVSDKKHCIICRHFRPEIPNSCRRGNSTGVKSNFSTYPFSYANHGCMEFIKIRM